MKLRYLTPAHVTRPTSPEIHFASVKTYDMESGITIKVTKISAKAMLTNNTPVRDLVSGFHLTINIRRIFPIRATTIVMEYSKTKQACCRVLFDSPAKKYKSL